LRHAKRTFTCHIGALLALLPPPPKLKILCEATTANASASGIEKIEEGEGEMKIACLGWGSLIWKPGVLPLVSEWRQDGPQMPIEFSRVGDGGELATAICMNAPLVQVCWALLSVDNIERATSLLREREQIPADRVDGVGSLILKSTPTGVLAKWAAEKALDAVIWTALPPRFAHIEGRIPSVEDALAYLASLAGEKRDHAQSYMKQVPAQFDTPYRRVIRQQPGWDC